MAGKQTKMSENSELDLDLASQEWGLSLLDHSRENSIELDFLTKLSQKIQLLLDNNPQKLKSHLYRLDISEEKYNRILTHTSPNNKAKKIAEVILEREKQKAITRKKFST